MNGYYQILETGHCLSIQGMYRDGSWKFSSFLFGTNHHALLYSCATNLIHNEYFIPWGISNSASEAEIRDTKERWMKVLAREKELYMSKFLGLISIHDMNRLFIRED